MNLTARSLPLTIVIYFCALGAVMASLGLALSLLTPAVYASLQNETERPVSRLEEVTATAREVRKALATPLPPVEPLGPITSRPARPVNEKAAASLPGIRLSAQARNAFASSEATGVRSGSVEFDRHRVH